MAQSPLQYLVGVPRLLLLTCSLGPAVKSNSQWASFWASSSSHPGALEQPGGPGVFRGPRASLLRRILGPAGPASNARPARERLRLCSPGEVQHTTLQARWSRPGHCTSARDDVPSPPIKGFVQSWPSLLSAAAPHGSAAPPPGRPAFEPLASVPLRAPAAPLRDSPPGRSRSLGIHSAVCPRRQPFPRHNTPGDGPETRVVFADK
ncbi:hypothetical protein NDU88_011496 [Pleurodeles waltl]|uniref:Uncharacterized protein n=1 Tax=Pleurodeles waltl TaxID=8319 RepID=A0AAV7S729_PLEWA|nr:hypothetical protein NDU88_011496 [Pleurodeles waltl]